MPTRDSGASGVADAARPGAGQYQPHATAAASPRIKCCASKKDCSRAQGDAADAGGDGDSGDAGCGKGGEGGSWL